MRPHAPAIFVDLDHPPAISVWRTFIIPPFLRVRNPWPNNPPSVRIAERSTAPRGHDSKLDEPREYLLQAVTLSGAHSIPRRSCKPAIRRLHVQHFINPLQVIFSLATSKNQGMRLTIRSPALPYPTSARPRRAQVVGALHSLHIPGLSSHARTHPVSPATFPRVALGLMSNALLHLLPHPLVFFGLFGSVVFSALYTISIYANIARLPRLRRRRP
ncbi:hypothetical protein B0H19DRAFT_1276341 [Mycena capillaripes]|nr:hypothetical protein B0H19DRAFT_1276341 [Mycena capillaripes]